VWEGNGPFRRSIPPSCGAVPTLSGLDDVASLQPQKKIAWGNLASGRPDNMQKND
jgi:hypothetical protein